MELESDDTPSRLNLDECAKVLKQFGNIYSDCRDKMTKFAEEVEKVLPKAFEARCNAYRRAQKSKNEGRASSSSQSKKATNAANLPVPDGQQSGAQADKSHANSSKGGNNKEKLKFTGNTKQQAHSQQLQVIMNFGLDRSSIASSSQRAEFMNECLDKLKFDEEMTSISDKLAEIEENVKKERVNCRPKKRGTVKTIGEGHEMKLRENRRGKDDVNDDDGETALIYTGPSYEGKKSEFKFQLTKHDVRTLEEGQYINDAIILFFLKFIQNDLLPEEMKRRIYIFDTYFIVKFREKCTNEFTKEKCIKAYQEMKKWTKNVDLLTKDFLIFPIHEMEHWSLIVVCYPSKGFDGDQSTNKMEAEEDEWKKPCIIAFDSLEPLQRIYPEMIQIYLEMERSSKRPELAEKAGEKNTHFKAAFCQMIVPKQNNLFDCGIFLLQYAELFLLNPAAIIKDLENWDRLSWFPRLLIVTKRDEIKKLIAGMGKGDKETAIASYVKARDNLLSITDEKSHDKINLGAFAEFKKEILQAQSVQESALASSDLEALKLQFYLRTPPPTE